MSWGRIKPSGTVRAARRGRVRRVLVVISLSAAAAVIAGRLITESRQNSAISEEIARLEDEARRIDSQNLELLELTGRLLESDVAEREARLKLGLRLPGEKVIVIESERAEDGLSEELAVREMGNPSRWWYYFFEDDRRTGLAALP